MSGKIDASQLSIALERAFNRISLVRKFSSSTPRSIIRSIFENRSGCVVSLDWSFNAQVLKDASFAWLYTRSSSLIMLNILISLAWHAVKDVMSLVL